MMVKFTYYLCVCTKMCRFGVCISSFQLPYCRYGVVHENASLPYSFSCTGTEKHLMGCQWRKEGTCRYPYDTVAIQCSKLLLSVNKVPIISTSRSFCVSIASCIYTLRCTFNFITLLHYVCLKYK